ncbi:hypothetical protein ARMGADRAFT_1008788 [Armillaria gallica]|uniref:Uncharacterized protein n=1 Tax=Armillaria gallica TaxID=47427 RepID=A0A2H3E5D7_ARMGA|nr:hypothetical protein ARMGADRAFT_1008788 [Armillaria gallica]
MELDEFAGTYMHIDVLNETTTSTRETVVSAAFEQCVRLILCHDPAKMVESPLVRDERVMMSDCVVTGEVVGEGSSSYGHSDFVQS